MIKINLINNDSWVMTCPIYFIIMIMIGCMIMINIQWGMHLRIFHENMSTVTVIMIYSFLNWKFDIFFYCLSYFPRVVSSFWVKWNFVEIVLETTGFIDDGSWQYCNCGSICPISIRHYLLLFFSSWQFHATNSVLNESLLLFDVIVGLSNLYLRQL